MGIMNRTTELLQSCAERAVSYRVGQVVLRLTDRALWLVEKSARWAVHPGLERDESAPPPAELVRPLAWPLFLALLLALRVAREAVSVANLLAGKPPVRPADVVQYIQSKRRYIRALKYQGNRHMRARAKKLQGGAISQCLSGVYSLLGRAMCVRRPTEHSGNNNTSAASNNDDEILVVRKSKRRDKVRSSGQASGQGSPPDASDENPMERLIEKMVDMHGESSDDSEYTLTNATSIKSDTSLCSDDSGAPHDNTITGSDQPASSTPNKPASPAPLAADCSALTADGSSLPADCSTLPADCSDATDALAEPERPASPARASEVLIRTEKGDAVTPKDTPKKTTKLANGKTPKSSPNSKKDSSNRRDSDVPVLKITPADDSNTNGSVEGSYSQSNPEEAPAKTKTVPDKTAKRSPKSNKTKESKIKPPFWRKSKK